MIPPLKLNVPGGCQESKVCPEDEELREVMHEALRTPRKELRAFIEEVAASTGSLDPGCTELACPAGYEQKLFALSRANEKFKEEVIQQTRHFAAFSDQLKTQVVNHEDLVAMCVRTQEELCKELAEHKRQLAASAQVQKKHEQQLLFPFLMQEEFRKEIADYRQHLDTSISRLEKQVENQQQWVAACVDAQEAVCKKLAEQKQCSNTKSKLQTIEEDMVKEITDLPDQQFLHADIVTHDALACIKAEIDTKISDLNTLAYDLKEVLAQLARQQDAYKRYATIEHVDKLFVDLHEHLLQLKGHAFQIEAEHLVQHMPDPHGHSHVCSSKIECACTSEQYLSLKAQIQELRAQMTKSQIQPDYVTSSDLESVLHAALTELRGHEAATKDYLDARMKELHAHLFQSKATFLTNRIYMVKDRMQGRLGEFSDADDLGAETLSHSTGTPLLVAPQ